MKYQQILRCDSITCYTWSLCRNKSNFSIQIFEQILIYKIASKIHTSLIDLNKMVVIRGLRNIEWFEIKIDLCLIIYTQSEMKLL